MQYSEQEIYYTVIVGGGLMIFLTGIIVFAVLRYKNRVRFHLKERELLKSTYQKELLQIQLEIQEQTLKNISQEIHDNIGQALTLAKLNLNTMPPTGADVQEKITTTKELVSKAIVDLRDLSRSLNTDYVANMGLEKAIEYELTLITKSSNIKTQFDTIGQSYRLTKQKELILFRIVQEVLNNTLKHAGASSIQALIKYGEASLDLSISDDGKGFDAAAIKTGQQHSNGLGLHNMPDRAKLIGAACEINSTPGAGTRIVISIPTDAV
jgi:two-component system, NarL family, sensor kinase